jgi:peptidoglycan/LPS O-acetylase OafA/YrhL
MDAGISPSNITFTRSEEMKNYFTGSQILHNIFYLPGKGYITPFWSLTYEVIFYLLAPFLLRRVLAYAAVSVILFLANFIAPSQIQSLGLPVYIHDFLFVFNIYFVVGVTLYTYFDKVSAWVERIPKKAWLGLMVFLVAAMYGVNIYFKIETVYSFLVSAALGTVLILYFLKYHIRIPWLMNVGKFSYTLYITHFATVFLYLGVYWLLVKPQVPYILNYFVWMPAVGLALLVGWIQYLLVEKRTKNILQLLRKKAQ